ncbi:MAG TPA: helicase-related protein [Edaphobacter sp.]|nr:helicase-related protein [Edaphobacter sp.]
MSIAHAEFMAESFRRVGIPAMALASQPSDEDRNQAARLRNREVNVLFTVDLFNDSVDIPDVDCVLFLRSTEISTVFLQQLGRGLRLDTGKTTCLVLDFIGNHGRRA